MRKNFYASILFWIAFVGIGEISAQNIVSEVVSNLNTAVLVSQAEEWDKQGEMTMNAIAQSISMIRMGNDMVVEPEFIQEFIKNCSRDVFQKIRDHIVSLKDQSELKPIKITCQNHECTKQYDTPFTMDVANFFVSAS